MLLVLLIIWLWQRQRFTKKLAETDTLTGAMNRRAMYTWINKLMPVNTSMCICLIDLDHFKKINDTYGHGTGDEVLETFSTIVQNRIRKTDRLCRFGGEEFLLVLNTVDKIEAQALLDEIRVTFEAHNQWNSTSFIFSASFSAGVIQLTGTAELDAVISQCDNLLYLAKGNGRAKTESSLFCAA
ncbi:GGDEF domain-containing protein [Pseudoalteromonas sp. KAN5]|uniref:GGDEF domain-containing protein n=1 Tax=Pseudoalteromonas sp. KAN5 TaxID=2916633 RepID=UPI001FCB4FA9|nr:GGDEF domain-containing protein [Pseudoalteromonas sp. KAN5]